MGEEEEEEDKEEEEEEEDVVRGEAAVESAVSSSSGLNAHGGCWMTMRDRRRNKISLVCLSRVTERLYRAES